MLGKLAKWLRLLGYDTVFSPDLGDVDIARRALREGRIVLTRDRGLAARKAVKRCLLIESHDYLQQLKQVIKEFGLKPSTERVFSYCLVCNRPVAEIAKEDVRELVPPYVLQTNVFFAQCPECHRVYWPGTHLKNTLEKLKEIL
jgi:uncharacterized protein with PIN domain